MTRTFLATLATATLVGGAAVADQTEITRTLTDIAAGADRHQWARVRDAFADTVTTDYTSLWGGDPGECDDRLSHADQSERRKGRKNGAGSCRRWWRRHHGPADCQASELEGDSIGQHRQNRLAFQFQRLKRV